VPLLRKGRGARGACGDQGPRLRGALRVPSASKHKRQGITAVVPKDEAVGGKNSWAGHGAQATPGWRRGGPRILRANGEKWRENVD
jgi:hypothetical protein